MREIKRFLNLGHNLCENDKRTLHDYIYEIYPFILGIFITDMGPCKSAKSFRAL